MQEELIVRFCSATLAGLKTGSIFNSPYSSITELYEDLRRLNIKLNKKGIRILPLRICEKRALIYVYRPKMLQRDLLLEDSKRLLIKNGYSLYSAAKCIVRLIERLKNKEDFPHEIGLFLGYPPEDVLGFIENEAKNSKLCGCWKVYKDTKTAKERFLQYRRCADIYMRSYQKGTSIESLAVTT